MAVMYTCLMEGDTEHKAPSVTTFYGIRYVEKWIDKHGVKVHRNAVLAGRCIHETSDGRWAMIFKSGPEALSTSVTLFRKKHETVMGDE